MFAGYAERFTAEGDTRVRRARARSARIVKKGFAVDDAMVDDFKALVVARSLKIDEEAWAKDLEFIRAMIRYDIDVALFGVADGPPAT